MRTKKIRHTEKSKREKIQEVLDKLKNLKLKISIARHSGLCDKTKSYNNWTDVRVKIRIIEGQALAKASTSKFELSAFNDMWKFYSLVKQVKEMEVDKPVLILNNVECVIRRENEDGNEKYYWMKTVNGIYRTFSLRSTNIVKTFKTIKGCKKNLLNTFYIKEPS